MWQVALRSHSSRQVDGRSPGTAHDHSTALPGSASPEPAVGYMSPWAASSQRKAGAMCSEYSGVMCTVSYFVGRVPANAGQ